MLKNQHLCGLHYLMGLVSLAVVLLGGLIGMSAKSPGSSQPAATSHSDMSRPAGIVLEMRGDWIAVHGDKSVPLRHLAAVPNGWTLQAVSPPAQSSITVLLVDGSKIKCPNGPTCGKPIALGKALAQAPQWWPSALSVLATRPERMLASGSRDRGLRSGAISLNDSVVSLASGKTDLGPVFKGAPSAVYMLRLDALTMGDARQKSPSYGPIEVKYAAGTAATIEIPGLKSGLYRLALLDQGEEPTGDEAWVLASDPKDYPRNLSTFRDAAQKSQDLKEDVEPESVRELLRSFLAVMDYIRDVQHR